jgi:hypothetical protein
LIGHDSLWGFLTRVDSADRCTIPGAQSVTSVNIWSWPTPWSFDCADYSTHCGTPFGICDRDGKLYAFLIADALLSENTIQQGAEITLRTCIMEGIDCHPWMLISISFLGILRTPTMVIHEPLFFCVAWLQLVIFALATVRSELGVDDVRLVVRLSNRRPPDVSSRATSCSLSFYSLPTSST